MLDEHISNSLLIWEKPSVGDTDTCVETAQKCDKVKKISLII